jgi:hypothetical protein
VTHAPMLRGRGHTILSADDDDQLPSRFVLSEEFNILTQKMDKKAAKSEKVSLFLELALEIQKHPSVWDISSTEYKKRHSGQ